MSELGEVGAAYAATRARITDLVSSADAVALAKVVPACPEWTVHNVVSHVTGVIDDALAGRLDGVATDRWTAAQVDCRNARATADVLAEWAELAPAFESMLDSIGPQGRQAVFDLTTHEHDLRGALGRPGARDSGAVDIGMSFGGMAITASATAAGHPGFRLRTGDGREWAGGVGEPAATLTARPFELMRACTGRRSLSQIRAMDWEGDPEPVLPAFTFGPFAPRPDPLVE